MNSFDIAARPVVGGRRRFAMAASAAVLILAASLAGAANAATATAASDDSTPGAAGAGAEGSSVTGLVVTAEQNQVTATAPTKGSLDETQPESIITSQYIQQATPDTGGWANVVLIAPSIAGAPSNAGGIGDYFVPTMRGFQDGEFNLTYDGIAWGDTNNPTHHQNDYFTASDIGAVVIDRGPGAAGDLGQANFGGAIHFFSPTVTDTSNATERLSYGNYNTLESVSTINTGEMSQLGGAKLLLNFDARDSSTELSAADGHEYNWLGKLIVPLGDKGSLTFFSSGEYNIFNFEDSSGPGETWAQVQALGDNFFMNNDPNSEHCACYNFEIHRTDFEYADFKYQLTPTFSFEDQPYTYHYSNKTESDNDMTGFTGPDENGTPAINGAAAVANTSPPKGHGAEGLIGGYDKLNEYRVLGNIARFQQDWTWGTLKWGGLVEGARTFRHNCLVNISLGLQDPDPDYASPPNANAVCKLNEESSWLQEQVFADFYLHPISNLTLTPGFKYVNFTRNVDASAEAVAGATGPGGVTVKDVPLQGSNTYKSPLYFFTGNYKITPDWAVYGQYATSFLIPELSDLYTTGVNFNEVKPETTINYQLGTVYTKGRLTADADVYLIDATNLQLSCSIPLAGGGFDSTFCNEGKARFDGVEGEIAYALPSGFTLFTNGGYNSATQLANAANAAQSIAANPQQELPEAPLWTAAIGSLYKQGPWQGSLTFKQVGPSVQYNTIGKSEYVFNLPTYSTFDASIGYDFGHFGVKLQAVNLLDDRTVTSFTPGSNSVRLYSAIGAAGTGLDGGFYTFEAGRQVLLTLIGKF